MLCQLRAELQMRLLLPHDAVDSKAKVKEKEMVAAQVSEATPLIEVVPNFLAKEKEKGEEKVEEKEKGNTEANIVASQIILVEEMPHQVLLLHTLREIVQDLAHRVAERVVAKDKVNKAPFPLVISLMRFASSLLADIANLVTTAVTNTKILRTRPLRRRRILRGHRRLRQRQNLLMPPLPCHRRIFSNLRQ